MKQLLLILACFTVLVFLNSCGEDECSPCAPVPEQPLAVHSVDSGIGSSGGFDSVRVLCYYSAFTDTLFDVYVDESDEGYTITINASNNPDFDEAVARLTNGVDDDLYFYLLFPNGGGGGGSSHESDYLDGGLTGEYDVDLEGAEVTKILLHMDYVSIDNQGSSTSCDIEYQVVFVGRP